MGGVYMLPLLVKQIPREDDRKKGNGKSETQIPFGNDKRGELERQTRRKLLGGEDLFFEGLLFEEFGVVAVAGEEFVVGS